MRKQQADYNRIKEWLIPILEGKGMTIEQLASAVGVTRSVIYYYIHDKSRPSEKVMISMCRVLGVPAEEGLRQYTPKKVGRPAGIGSGARPLIVRR